VPLALQERSDCSHHASVIVFNLLEPGVPAIVTGVEIMQIIVEGLERSRYFRVLSSKELPKLQKMPVTEDIDQILPRTDFAVVHELAPQCRQEDVA
jgi:hypothetical protein